MTSATPALRVVKTGYIFACPACSGDLMERVDLGEIILECVQCNRNFECRNNIPLLFWPNQWHAKADVTDIAKSFYEENPFPGYENIDSAEKLREKAERSFFARLLDEEIFNGARILEAGCGTGQLSNFLGMKWGRSVFGTDMCLNSLTLGQRFKETNQIENVSFFQMNLFRPIFKPETFDFVISNGVLHHTSDPFLGFQTILRLVKKGGFILIGLYNRIGRIPTNVRRSIFRITRDRFKFLDPRFRDKGLDSKKREIWFADQYKHPHESSHSIEEVLDWFQRCDVKFVNSVPKTQAFRGFSSSEKLFSTNPRGSQLDHVLVELGMLLGGGREGGFFIMIGQK